MTELTGWLGHVRERYEYDVYGQPTLRNNVGTVITASQFGNRFLFQGRDRDPDTGLYNFRYRTYSPTLGRFLQVDPIREEGGWNMYAFVLNSPLNQTDPLGLKLWESIIAAAEAAALAALPGGEFVAALQVFGSCNSLGLALAWAKKEYNDCMADALMGDPAKCAAAEKECGKKWDAKISLMQKTYDKHCRGKN